MKVLVSYLRKVKRIKEVVTLIKKKNKGLRMLLQTYWFKYVFSHCLTALVDSAEFMYVCFSRVQWFIVISSLRSKYFPSMSSWNVMGFCIRLAVLLSLITWHNTAKICIYLKWLLMQNSWNKVIIASSCLWKSKIAAEACKEGKSLGTILLGLCTCMHL